ncbi:MAG TPA: FAD-binding oxidoreductase [Methylomirabilota bacterium]|nr:FAD-binding oxidoreductase [Methylomirabilota bacterium]
MAASPSAAITRALEAIAGPGRVCAEASALAGAAVDGVIPRWIVRAAAVEQVARVLALASSESLAVAPRGAGSSLGLGAPPRRLDLVLDLSRLDAVLDYVPEDMVASVQAGISLDALAGRLGQYGQRLPLDPAPGGMRSVGGVLATAASGPLRVRYGTGRDLLLGVRFVQADGVITWGGARVVKSVTGYDVPKLLVGSLGTLGVIVEATLRLHPITSAWGAWLWRFDAVPSAAAFIAAVVDSAIQPERVVLLDGAAAAVAAGEEARAEAAVAVSVASTAEAVAAQREALGALATRHDGRASEIGAGAWARLSEALTGPVVLRLAGEPARLGPWMVSLAHVARDGGVDLLSIGEAGGGVIRAALRTRAGAGVPAPSWLAGAVASLRASLEPEGGSLVVERAPRAVKDALDVWGPVAPEALALMRRLKSEFDPAGILNPGRFVGGL